MKNLPWKGHDPGQVTRFWILHPLSPQRGCHGPLQMEKDDKGSTMIRMGVSGWKFLLVPAYPGCPGSKAVKRSSKDVLMLQPSASSTDGVGFRSSCAGIYCICCCFESSSPAAKIQTATSWAERCGNSYCWISYDMHIWLHHCLHVWNCSSHVWYVLYSNAKVAFWSW